MKYRSITEPFAEPIHLDEAKAHLRQEEDLDDALIQAHIETAREEAEDVTGRQLVSATYELLLDAFPCHGPIKIPHVPLASVTHIKYYDSEGALQTLAATVYAVDAVAEPGEISLAYGQSWPCTYDQPNAVIIRYVCGHVTPFTVDHDTNVLTAQGRTFAAGDVVRLSNSGGSLPCGLAERTDYYVISPSGSTLQLSATSGGSAIDITDDGQGTHFIGVLPAQIRQGMLLHIQDLYDGTEAGADARSSLYWKKRTQIL